MVIADAAFGRAFDRVVMDAKAGEHAHVAIVHFDGKVNNQLALTGAQVEAQIIVQIHKIGHGIQLRLGNGIGAFAKCRMERVIVARRIVGIGNLDRRGGGCINRFSRRHKLLNDSAILFRQRRCFFYYSLVFRH